MIDGVIAKQDILKMLDELPDDADLEDAMERLYLAFLINKSFKQIQEGKTLSQEEVKARLKKWMKDRQVSGATLAESLDETL